MLNLEDISKAILEILPVGGQLKNSHFWHPAYEVMGCERITQNYPFFGTLPLT